MQLGDSRPPSVLGHASDWPARDPHSSSSAPPSAFSQSATLAQRRRSSAYHTPPPAPPPSQPIPSVPILDTTTYDLPSRQPESSVGLSHSGSSPNLSQFARPLASPNLAAIAAFSQSRSAATSQSPPAPLHHGLDMPPQSSTRQPSTSRHQEIIPDRLLLSPQDPQLSATEPRPSSRRALTKALELAREAVKLDSTNDDPYGAVIAYGKSVALLSKVMERVMRGEDSTETHRKRGGRRRSVVAQEEEVKRLKAIHDTYADRMNILSLIYSIPPIPHSPTSLYTASISASTDSTQPPSPTSGSPSSESSDQTPFTPSLLTDDGDDGRRYSTEDTIKLDGDIYLNGEELVDGLPTPAVHPYAAPARISVEIDPQLLNPPPPAPAPARTSTAPLRLSRPRASSALPPPVPPPQSSLPPAPAPESAPSTKHLNVTTRPRGNSTGHVRSGSGSRLASLQEESERSDEPHPQSVSQPQTDAEEEYRRPRTRSILQAQSERETLPLPPLPPSVDTLMEPTTPRTVVNGSEQLSPPSSAKFTTPRPRGASTVSTRSEMVASHPGIINSSTTMGTISQRRSKASAPPGSGSPQMGESVPPSAMKMSTSGLPMSSNGQPYGRSRASSQPGHRPNLAGLPPVSFDMPPRPPSVSSSIQQNGGVTRKSSSATSRHQLPQISVLTGMLSPTIGTPINQLVPPPPIPHNNLPTTPTSPLPPAPPSDSMRQPYHMMNLLRHTMTSKSGGYITRRLHVPHEVWSQGGAKLTNLPEKVRVVEVLCSALEELQNTSGEIFGAGNVSSGMGMGIGGVSKKEGELWAAKLEEFSTICDGVVANFGKKLGVGEGFVLKKSSGVTSWGGKLTRQFDKLTNAKNLDSPASYVSGLSKLFLQAQLLDEHCKALLMQPIAPTYAALPIDLRPAYESKLRRASEFFATVVLTFVIRDLAQLLDKYVKKCEKWLAE
ncbi:hypothetical protein DENSPDRAFT_479153 [Dentipellis sp. KUC8613]|nr:hypothetical protein DENSPDRAFT_479153 [Dentipellis sp. KUC8613]